MTKNRALDGIPKIHIIRKNAAEAICHLVYPGMDKEFRKSKTREIEEWLARENLVGNEDPVELAGDWQEYSRGSG